MTAALALSALQAHADPITLNFDDLAVGTNLTNYGGFTWTAFGGWPGTGSPPPLLINNEKEDGFQYAAVSGANYVANSQYALTAKWNGPGTFDFIGAWWTALLPVNRGAYLEFAGFKNGVRKFSTTDCNARDVCPYGISSQQATEFNLNWTDIDTLEVVRGGGLGEVTASSNWALDNFTFAPRAAPQPPVTTPVPEPSGLALVAAGLAALAGGRRRQAKPSGRVHGAGRQYGPAAWAAAGLSALGAATSASAGPIRIDYSGSTAIYTTAAAGLYEIVAYGAAGGGAIVPKLSGGSGAQIGGSFLLGAGQSLVLAIGGMGGTNVGTGGGGGGTFVLYQGQALVVAGGGGGAANDAAGLDALTTGLLGGLGGASGGSGGFSAPGNGAGGGGLNGDGGDVNAFNGVTYARGGAALLSTTQGGTGAVGGGAGGAGGGPFAGAGGFGGGGGGGSGSGGGGGGYSGGQGGGTFTVRGGGGGGGSYLAAWATDPILNAGMNVGAGYVTIDFVPQTLPSPVPEPGSFALAGLGLLAAAAVRRQRR